MLNSHMLTEQETGKTPIIPFHDAEPHCWPCSHTFTNAYICKQVSNFISVAPFKPRVSRFLTAAGNASRTDGRRDINQKTCFSSTCIFFTLIRCVPWTPQTERQIVSLKVGRSLSAVVGKKVSLLLKWIYFSLFRSLILRISHIYCGHVRSKTLPHVETI